MIGQMLAKADPSQVEGLSRFFKTGPGQYGEGDRFLGIKVPVTRGVVKECWKQTGFDELEECLASEYHEIRLAGLLALVEIYSHARKDMSLRSRCIDFYLSHTDRINNWDLVDLSCYNLLGDWLLDKDRSLLYRLASDGKNIWDVLHERGLRLSTDLRSRFPNISYDVSRNGRPFARIEACSKYVHEDEEAQHKLVLPIGRYYYRFWTDSSDFETLFLTIFAVSESEQTMVE